MKTKTHAEPHGGSPRKRVAALYINRDNETYKIFTGEEIFCLAYGFKDFLKGTFMAERSASSYRIIANRFMHFLEKEGRPPGDIKAAGDFLAQLKAKSLGYHTALKWFYVFLEKQGITNIHPHRDLKVNLSYFRELNPAVGNGSAFSGHNKNLSRQVHNNYRLERENGFL